MPLGVRRSHMPAAISACGTAPVASTTQCARISCAASPDLEARAADAASGERLLEACRRDEPRARRLRGAAQDVVELPSRQHGQRAGHLDAPAARDPRAADVGRRLRLGHHPRAGRAAPARRARRGSGRRRRPCRAETATGRRGTTSTPAEAPARAHRASRRAGADDETSQRGQAERRRGVGTHRGSGRAAGRQT